MWSSFHSLHDRLGTAEAVYLGQRCLQAQASFWALIFLKTYTTESPLVVAIGVDEKTLQKWIFIIICSISDLEDDWVGSLCSEDSSDISNNCFSTDQMGEQVSWILWQIMPGDGGWGRLLDM